MRHNITLIIIFIALSLAIWGIFALIFPSSNDLMQWCVASGILMVATIMFNLLIYSSNRSLTVRNSATAWILNVSGTLLFVWTLLFTFSFGSYVDSERNLNVLYVGYLIIFLVSTIILYIAYRGSVSAQSQSNFAQNQINKRETYISEIRQLKIRLRGVEPDVHSDIHKKISLNIDLMRNIPASEFENQSINQQLFDAVEALKTSIDCNDLSAVNVANKQLSEILKSLKI